MSISKIAYTLISFLAAIIILSYGKNLIMPFILALFIWLLIKEIKKVCAAEVSILVIERNCICIYVPCVGLCY